MTHFKVSKDIKLDWYSFKAGNWYELGGDFLCNPSPENLMATFKECEVDMTDLRVEYK